MVNFFPNGCIFQDMLLGKRIDSGKEVDGLFILEEEKITQALQAEQSSGNKDGIMRWHYRLGHPNFKYLKLLFPSLFENKSMSDFQCEVCEFAKCRNQEERIGGKNSLTAWLNLPNHARGLCFKPYKNFR